MLKNTQKNTDALSLNPLPFPLSLNMLDKEKENEVILGLQS